MGIIFMIKWSNCHKCINYSNNINHCRIKYQSFK